MNILLKPLGICVMFKNGSSKLAKTKKTFCLCYGVDFYYGQRMTVNE